MKYKSPYFIVEVSSNHSQDFDRCIKFIELSKKINASAVKFQLFDINKLFAPEILNVSKMHRDRSSWELPKEFIPDLYKRSKELSIDFGCTPFYLEAVDFLYDYVDFYKVASFELLWDDLLIEIAKTKKRVIISTGMADEMEVLHAVKVLKENGSKDISILHCNSSYPTPIDDSNLSAIKTLSMLTGLKSGWSDHTRSKAVLYRAIHKWNAAVIEAHLGIDGMGEEYQDHCWLPDDLAEVISRCIELDDQDIDGDGIIKYTKSESSERMWRRDPEDGLRPFIETRSIFARDHKDDLS